LGALLELVPISLTVTEVLTAADQITIRASPKGDPAVARSAASGRVEFTAITIAGLRIFPRRVEQ
jgi:hypothetical protein